MICLVDRRHCPSATASSHPFTIRSYAALLRHHAKLPAMVQVPDGKTTRPRRNTTVRARHRHTGSEQNNLSTKHPNLFNPHACPLSIRGIPAPHFPFAPRTPISYSMTGSLATTGPTPSLDAIEKMARDTIAALPAPFLGPAQDVLLRVADWPDTAMLHDLAIHDPLDLTGLYEGVPMTRKSMFDFPTRPDTVWLFREPILEEWRARGNVTLAALVAHVTVHEFAHHFGWSDADIAQIDRWWE